MAEKITVDTTVEAPLRQVWEYFTTPEHIMAWSQASEDWHTPRASNDLRVGGHFSYRMEAKDGSTGFDFNGTYDEIEPFESISYTIEGGRKVVIVFIETSGQTHVTETFEAENENPIEVQRGGWQAILDSFKRYVESS